MEVPKKPLFEPLKPQDMVDAAAETQFRVVDVPQHRLTPLKKVWKTHIYQPIRDDMKIDIRMNLKYKVVQLKTMPETPDISNLDKCTDYVRAFVSGFEAEQIKDAFLKYDQFYLDYINIKDVKRVIKGEHKSHTIGRICGKGGKTKFAIENATRTRIVVADEHVYFVGTCDANKIAKDCICRLIMGSPIGSVYSRLQKIVSRMDERF